MEECGQTKVTKRKEPKKCPNSGTRSIKDHSITKTTSQWSWPIWTIKNTLRVAQMLPAINLEQ